MRSIGRALVSEQPVYSVVVGGWKILAAATRNLPTLSCFPACRSYHVASFGAGIGPEPSHRQGGVTPRAHHTNTSHVSGSITGLPAVLAMIGARLRSVSMYTQHEESWPDASPLLQRRSTLGTLTYSVVFNLSIQSVTSPDDGHRIHHR